MARNPSGGFELIGMAVDGVAIALHHGSAFAPLIVPKLTHILCKF